LLPERNSLLNGVEAIKKISMSTAQIRASHPLQNGRGVTAPGESEPGRCERFCAGAFCSRPFPAGAAKAYAIWLFGCGNSVMIDFMADRILSMPQPALIDKILAAIGLNNIGKF
jgi:hypothetical protein